MLTHLARACSLSLSVYNVRSLSLYEVLLGLRVMSYRMVGSGHWGLNLMPLTLASDEAEDQVDTSTLESVPELTPSLL